jgi:hypothetical protein
MKQFSKQMGQVVGDMESVLSSMDPERINKMMDKFEKQFENLDVGAWVDTTKRGRESPWERGLDMSIMGAAPFPWPSHRALLFSRSPPPPFRLRALVAGSATMEESIGRATATSMPDKEIEEYLEGLQQQHQIELNKQMRDSMPGTSHASASASAGPERVAAAAGGVPPAVPPPPGAGGPQPPTQPGGGAGAGAGTGAGAGAGGGGGGGGGGGDITDALAARLAALRR